MLGYALRQPEGRCIVRGRHVANGKLVLLAVNEMAPGQKTEPRRVSKQGGSRGMPHPSSWEGQVP